MIGVSTLKTPNSLLKFGTWVLAWESKAAGMRMEARGETGVLPSWALESHLRMETFTFCPLRPQHSILLVVETYCCTQHPIQAYCQAFYGPIKYPIKPLVHAIICCRVVLCSLVKVA